MTDDLAPTTSDSRLAPTRGDHHDHPGTEPGSGRGGDQGGGQAHGILWKALAKDETRRELFEAKPLRRAQTGIVVSHSNSMTNGSIG